MAMLPIVISVLAGMCICAGIYHLIHGLYRPHNRAVLLFSLVCLLVATYTLTGPLAAALAAVSIPAMPVTWLFLAASACTWFLVFYADIPQRRLPLAISIVGVLVAGINLFVPSLPLIALAALPAIGLVGLGGYASYRLYRAGVYRSAWVLIGTLFLGLALFVSELMIEQLGINLPYLLAYAFPLLVLIMSGDLVARAAQSAYSTAELARRETRARGEQEDLVIRRTRQLRRRADELASLNSIAKKVATITDVPVLLQQVSEMLRAMFQAHAVLITLLDSHKTTLKVVVASTLNAEGYTEISTATFALADYPLAHEAIAQGESVVVDNAQTNIVLAAARDILGKYTIQSVLLVSLRAHGDTIGLLTLTSDRPGMVFGRDEVALAETIAGYIAAVIENACLPSHPQAESIQMGRHSSVPELGLVRNRL